MRSAVVIAILVLACSLAFSTTPLHAGSPIALPHGAVNTANDLSAGIAELTEGVPDELLGGGTHATEWTGYAAIDIPLSAMPPRPDTRAALAITQFDMLDWQTLDSWSDHHTEGPDKDYANGGQPCLPNPCGWWQGTVVWSNKIYYLKEPSGSTWDINLYDSNYIYDWITELAYGTPRDYKKWYDNTNMPMTPRVARAGYPGEQIFIPKAQCANATYQNCVLTHLGYGLGSVIQQIWGPYENVYLGGNMGSPTIVKRSYFYGCSGTTTDTCGTAEVNWYAQQYGWVRWGLYTNVGGSFVLVHDYRAANVVPGGATINFPCF